MEKDLFKEYLIESEPDKVSKGYAYKWILARKESGH